MTYVNVAHAERIAPAPLRAPLLELPGSLPGTWIRRARQRRELKHLLRHSDRILADIGAEREELDREASKPFWQA